LEALYLEALGLLIIVGSLRPHSGKHISSQSGRQPVWQCKKYEKVLKNIKKY
jgi:hypothetical protein